EIHLLQPPPAFDDCADPLGRATALHGSAEIVDLFLRDRRCGDVQHDAIPVPNGPHIVAVLSDVGDPVEKQVPALAADENPRGLPFNEDVYLPPGHQEHVEEAGKQTAQEEQQSNGDRTKACTAPDALSDRRHDCLYDEEDEQADDEWNI